MEGFLLTNITEVLCEGVKRLIFFLRFNYLMEGFLLTNTSGVLCEGVKRLRLFKV